MVLNVLNARRLYSVFYLNSVTQSVTRATKQAGTLKGLISLLTKRFPTAIERFAYSESSGISFQQKL